MRRFITAVEDTGLRVALTKGKYLRPCEPGAKSGRCKEDPLY